MRAEGNIGGQRASVWFNRVHGTEWKQGEGGAGEVGSSQDQEPREGAMALGPCYCHPLSGFLHRAPPLGAP